MPEVTGPYEPGTPCWIDLMVPDQQAGLDFYRDLFGWQAEIGPEEYGGYSVCTQKGKPAAGLMKTMTQEGQPTPPTAWTTYFAVTDADAAEAAVKANGGKVLMPTSDVMTLGRMFVAADPQGAVFGVWEARDFKGAEIVNEHGTLVWNQLFTSDPAAAADFYSAVLGVTVGPLPDMPDFTGVQVKGRPVGGVDDLSRLPEGTPPHWHVNFAVDDADSTVDALVRANGTVLQPPFDMEKIGRMAVVQDPQGAVFSVVAVAGS